MDTGFQLTESIATKSVGKAYIYRALGVNIPVVLVLWKWVQRTVDQNSKEYSELYL